MSLIESMSELEGGGRRSRRGKRRTNYVKKDLSLFRSILSGKSSRRKKRRAHTKRNNRKSRKGSIMNQLMPKGFLGSLFTLGPKRRKRSRRHRHSRK